MRACSHQCVCIYSWSPCRGSASSFLHPPALTNTTSDLWPGPDRWDIPQLPHLQETLSKCRETLLRSSRISAYLWTLYSKSGVCWNVRGHPVGDPAGLRDLHLYKNTGISSESRTFIDPVTPHIFMFTVVPAQWSLYKSHRLSSQLFLFIPRRRLDPDGQKWTLNWWRCSCSSNDAYLDLWCMESALCQSYYSSK